MHITIVCPSCQTRYQVDSSLRGARMRCPSANCREVFEVQEFVPPAAPVPPSANAGTGAPVAPAGDRSRSNPPPVSARQSGSVGDMVPILPAENAGSPPSLPVSLPPTASRRPQGEEVLPLAEIEPEPGRPAEPLSWHQTPPVRRGQGPAAPGKPLGGGTPPLPSVVPNPPPAAPAPSDPTDWRTGPPPRRSAGGAPPDWQKTPPPRQAEAAPAAPPPPRAKDPSSVNLPRVAKTPARPAPAAPEPVREVPAGSWQDAPPVRRSPGGPSTVEAEPAPAKRSPDYTETTPSKSARTRTLVVIAVIVVVAGLIGGIAGVVMFSGLLQSEDSLAREAQQAYAKGDYPAAATKYRTLIKRFGDTSSRVPEYQFWADLSELHLAFASATVPPDAMLDQVEAFLKNHEKDPLLQAQARDLGGAFVKWLLSRLRDAKEAGVELPLDFIDRAKKTVELVKALPRAIPDDELAALGQAFGDAELAEALRHEHIVVLNKIKGLKPSGDAVKEALRLIKEHNQRESGFDQNPEVLAELDRLYKGHYERVTYTPKDQQLERPRLAEDVDPGLLVEQLLQGSPPPAQPNDPIVLALVRGVLYGLSQANGRIVWAMRVGIDTTALPMRLPASGSRPEIVLALSSDTETLTAVHVATGDALWKYRLSAPCLGQPVVVDQRAYIPTYDGWVHEIELARGHLLGHYQLGQHLTVGGTRQPGTKLVYFPADDTCIYVLDVAARQCQKVLYSRHPSGSLRSPPLVVGGGGAEGYLILNQTDGLDAMQLRAFSLPIQDPNAPALTMQTEPRVRGWSWFQPYHDPEKVVLVTDAGVVGLFGIRQPRNPEDAPLFPLLPQEIRLEGSAPDQRSAPGRAQCVSCQGENVWVLTHGDLQKLLLTLSTTGPRLTVDESWREPLQLGSPLHASQTDAGGNTLFLVTQSLTRPGCLATAVDANTKEVRWQRQLGLVCQGQPLLLGGAGGQGVLALDQAGGVSAFHPASHPNRTDLQWQIGGQALAKPLEDNPNLPPSLHPGSDGTSAYEIACPGQGTTLVLRRFRVDKDGQKINPTPGDETVVPGLNAPPAGEPAVRGGSLLLPLRDGTVVRLRLPAGGAQGDGKHDVLVGPDWRSSRASPDARGYVTWINDQEFLTTDGAGGVTHWVWPEGKPCTALPNDPLKDAKDPTTEVRARIVAAPLVLPGGDDLRACVADASGTVSLLHGERLEEVRHWDLGGQVTTGPFLRGTRIGCVVDRRRLVWLDPEQNNPVWEYLSVAGEIVGQPQLIEGMLVVAHQSGLYLGLDPSSGQKFGKGYTLKASVAPAASPVGFGPGRAFAPLTDGTVLLLALHHLRDPLEDFPIVW